MTRQNYVQLTVEEAYCGNPINSHNLEGFYVLKSCLPLPTSKC